MRGKRLKGMGGRLKGLGRHPPKTKGTKVTSASKTRSLDMFPKPIPKGMKRTPGLRKD